MEKQEAEADSVLRFAREVIALRKSCPELHAGSIESAAHAHRGGLPIAL